jgi:signal peptidase I
MLKIIKVTGNSLSPFFLPDDYVLINTSRRNFKQLATGDTIVFTHPAYGRLIKFVRTNSQVSESILVGGSQEDSISSHKLGEIPYADLLGKVIFHFKPRRPLA